MRRKRLLALVLSLSLVMGMTPVTALAEGNGEQQEDSEVCICTVPCTEESRNADCPVCGVEEADLSMCGAEGAETKDTKSELDEEVDKVQALIDALPAAEDLENMSLKEQQTVYEQVQAAYDEYDALTDEQKEQITGAEIFDGLFAVFNNMVSETADNVTYLDETGTEQTCTSATSVTADDRTWETGWYVAEGTISISHTLTVNGDVKLILADGASLSVSVGSNEIDGIKINQGASLTIYGQTAGSGVLTTKGGSAPGQYGTSYGSGISGYGGALTLVGVTLKSDGVNTSSGTLKALNGANIDVDVTDRFHNGISIGTFEVIDSTIDVLIPGRLSSSNAAISGLSTDTTLTVRGSSTVSAVAPEQGIYLGNLELYGGTVTAKCTDCNYASGAVRAYNVKVKGGKLTADATGSDSSVSAFYMGGRGEFSVSDGIVEATANGNSYVYAINGTNTTLNISGGMTSLTATAQNTGYAAGMRVNIFTITGGTISATGSGNTNSNGIYASKYDPPISGGTITAIGSGVAIFTQEYSSTTTGGLTITRPEIIPVIDSRFSHVTYVNRSMSPGGAVIADESAETFQWPDYKYIKIEPKTSQTTVPDAPTLNNSNTTGIVLNTVTSTGGTGNIQYAYTTGDETSVPESRWQNSTTFTRLASGTEYVFYARYAGDATIAPSDPSNGTTIYTLPAITTSSLTAGTVGQTYTTTLAVTSAETVTWSATGLPDGLSLNSTTGEISGTPTKAVTNQAVEITATIGSGTNIVSNTAILSITINAGTPAITANTYNGTTQTGTFTYGDTITITGSITASTTAPGTSMNAITQNQVGLYLEDNTEELATANVTTDNTFTLTYNTAGKGIPVGQSQTLTIKYGGSGDLTTGSTTVSVTLKAKSVTAQVKGDITKVYDGDKKATVNLTVTKVNTSDDITVTAPNAVYDDANVGEKKVVILGELAVAGKDSGWYQVSAPSDVTGSITHDQLDAPANLIWNGTKASWDAVSNASGYSVTLYLEQSGSEEDKAVKKVTTDNTSYDFSNDITEAGSYYVSVTAKGTGNYSDSESGTSTAVTYYNVTVSSDVTGGSAEASPEVAMSGTKITLTTTADQGYHFWKWTTDPADLSSSINQDTSNADTWTFTMPAQHVSLTPVFEAVPNAPSVAATASGEDYKSGTWTSGDVTFTISGSTADSGIAVYQYSTDNDVSWNDLTVTDGRATLTVSDESATADGTEYLFRAVSEAGAAGAASDAFVVRIDKTSPGITVKGTNTTGYHQDAEITITPSVGVSGVSKVEVSSDNGSTWEDITDSYQSGYKVEANGTYTFRVTNAAGAMATDSITYNNIDRAAPVVLITAAAGGGDYTDNTWTNQDITLSVSNSIDNLGTTEYEYKVGSGEWQTYSAPITISDETDGMVYTFRGTSASGITSEEESITVKLDKTAPTGEIEIGENRWNQFLNTITFGLFFKNTQTVTVSSADDASGIDAAEYFVSDTPYADSEALEAAANGEWSTCSGSFSIEPDSKNIIYAKVIDHAGNVVYVSSTGIVLYTDAEQATESISFTKTGTEDVDAEVTLNGNTIDEIYCDSARLTSGTDYTVNGSTITFRAEWLDTLAAGDYTLTVHYNPLGVEYVDNSRNDAPATTDIALNVQKAAGSVTITNDISRIYDGSAVSDVTYSSLSTGDVTVEYKVRGTGDSTYTLKKPSGVDEYTVRVTVEADGDYNEASATADFDITYLTAPADPFGLSGTEGTDGWYLSDVTVTPADGYTVSDNLGGEYADTLTISASAEDVSIYLKNGQGQMTSAISVGGIKIDKDDPEITVTGDTETIATSDHVSIDVSDGTSGVKKAEVKKDEGVFDDITDSCESGYTVNENGTYTFRATDQAGRTAEKTLTYTNIDRADPVVLITAASGGDYYTDNTWTNQDITLSVSNSTDNLGTTEYEYKVGSGEWQTYSAPITISDETDGMVYTFRGTSASSITGEEESITVKLDKTAPTGEIKIGENGWKSFLNTITFGMFFKDTQTVSIDSADNLSGIAKVEYASSSESLTLEEVQSLTDWTEGESVDVTPEDGKRFIYYARITDNAGNVVCLSTDGAEYDLTAPVINGISDGGTYCISAEFTVSEKNLEEVQVDGAPVTARSDVYTLTPGEHIITVTDKADNSTQIRVTVNETHTPEEDDGDCTTAVRCAVCGKVTTPEQEHDFSGELKADESGHWYECRNEGCTVTSEKAGHSGGRADCVLQAVCDECGLPYGDKDPANHTNLVKTEAKPATHLAEGNTEYWYCDGCDKYFSDEAGTQEIALADTIIPKLAEHTADGTGWHKDEDSHWHTCLCGEVIDKADHTFEWVTDKEATSTEAGSKHEECAVCGYKKEAVEIPATGVPTEPKEPGKPSEPAEPSEPEDPSEPAEPSKSNEPAETAPVSDKDTADQAAAVATGYDSNITLWVSLILASGLAIVGTAVYTRKKKYRR